MARTPPIRYFDSREASYTQDQGKQHCLATGPKDEPEGPTFRKAATRFAEIIHLDDARRAEDNPPVSVVISCYKQHLKNQDRSRTLAMTTRCLDSAIETFGSIRIKDLTRNHVQDWLNK